jgi:hypothetical protein
MHALVFIIEGVLTIAVGFIAPFFLADCKSQKAGWSSLTSVAVPEKAKFLNERQKHIATTRLLEGRRPVALEHANPRQVLGMLRDWKLLVL